MLVELPATPGLDLPPRRRRPVHEVRIEVEEPQEPGLALTHAREQPQTLAGHRGRPADPVGGDVGQVAVEALAVELDEVLVGHELAEAAVELLPGPRRGVGGDAEGRPAAVAEDLRQGGHGDDRVAHLAAAVPVRPQAGHQRAQGRRGARHGGDRRGEVGALGRQAVDVGRTGGLVAGGAQGVGAQGID